MRTVDRVVWVDPIDIADPQFTNRAATVDALTANVADYLRKARAFREVNTMPGQPGANDLLLRIHFDRYRQGRQVHPAYFPAALLTLTIYIWAGGPIYNDVSDLAGRAQLLAMNGALLAEAPSAISESHTVSLWSPEYGLPSGVEARSRIVRDLVDKVVEGLERRRQ